MIRRRVGLLVASLTLLLLVPLVRAAQQDESGQGVTAFVADNVATVPRLAQRHSEVLRRAMPCLSDGLCRVNKASNAGISVFAVTI